MSSIHSLAYLLLVCLQLFEVLEANSASQITASCLYMALLAWVNLENSTAGHAAVQRHASLAADWEAKQQLAAFQGALGLVQEQAGAAAAVLLAQHVCMLAVAAQMPNSAKQVHDLVCAMLLQLQTRGAFQVSCTTALRYSAGLQKAQLLCCTVHCISFHCTECFVPGIHLSSKQPSPELKFTAYALHLVSSNLHVLTQCLGHCNGLKDFEFPEAL